MKIPTTKNDFIEQLRYLIKYMISYNMDGGTSEMLTNAMEDPDKNEEAINDLIELLEGEL